MSDILSTSVSGLLAFQRALDVTSNYVFAYAFDRPSGVVVIHSETHWMFPLSTTLRPSSRFRLCHHGKQGRR